MKKEQCKCKALSLFSKNEQKNITKKKKKLDDLLRRYCIYASDTLIEEICKIFK